MMEGLGVSFLSLPVPVSTNSVQKDEVHAQVCNRMLQWFELIEFKMLISLNCRMIMPPF